MKNIIFILILLFGAIPTLKADVKKWKLEPVGFLNIDRNEKDYGGFSGLVTVSYTHLTLPTSDLV